MSSPQSPSRRSSSAPPPRRLQIILDADVPNTAIAPLEALGLEVIDSKVALPEGTPDEGVVRFAEEIGAIIMTCNGKHFRRLASRQNTKLRRVGLILVDLGDGRHASLPKRIDFLGYLLLAEMQHPHADPRVFLTIHGQRITVER